MKYLLVATLFICGCTSEPAPAPPVVWDITYNGQVMENIPDEDLIKLKEIGDRNGIDAVIYHLAAPSVRETGYRKEKGEIEYEQFTQRLRDRLQGKKDLSVNTIGGFSGMVVQNDIPKAVRTVKVVGPMNHDERLIWDMRWGLHRMDILLEELALATGSLQDNRKYIREHIIRDIMGSK